MTRGALRLSLILTVAVLALISLCAVPAGSTEQRAVTTVVVNVRYWDHNGDRQPLAGVEVWLNQDGKAYFQCTNAKGKATFKGVVPYVDLTVSSGPAFFNNCANPEFLNPDTGQKMFAEYYNGHHGVPAFDPFQVISGQRKVIKLNVTTPSKQDNVCGGAKVTIMGTNGRDLIYGTSHDDVINGLSGNDVIHGLDGEDIICGDAGDDSLYGEGGYDSLFGEAGNDSLEGGGDVDVLYGGAQSDRCRGELLFSCEH